MLQVGMELYLVDCRRNVARLEDPLELLWEIVADTDGLCEALALKLFHLLPLLLMVFFLVAEEGSVDEIATPPNQHQLWKILKRDHIQVNIVHLKLLQTRLQRRGNIGNVADDLRNQVEFLSRHAGLLDGCAELGLCLVDFGAVLVVVTHVDGHLRGIDAGLIDFRFVAAFVPSCTCAVANLESC